MINYCSCFISYSHIDIDFAVKLYNALCKQGVRSWRDEAELRIGQQQSLAEILATWDKILIIASDTALQHPWIKREIEGALVYERCAIKRSGQRINKIIPVCLDDTLYDNKHPLLKKRYVANLRQWRDVDVLQREISYLLRALIKN